MVFFIEEFDFKEMKNATREQKPMDLRGSKVSAGDRYHETSTRRARHVRYFDDMIKESGVCAVSNENDMSGVHKKRRIDDVVMKDLYKGKRDEVDWMETEMGIYDVGKASVCESKESTSSCTWTSSTRDIHAVSVSLFHCG